MFKKISMIKKRSYYPSLIGVVCTLIQVAQ